MAGFREYLPGEVWFYYNPQATKKIEAQKDLGAVTCRPVVIIQHAFYPEWNDVVTVVPMTHSDRRSGVYIDNTILSDGTLVSGGTVIPYMFYNVRTKYLSGMIGSNTDKRKCISLSPEDFGKVKEGYLYHLGASKVVPEYVKRWKHLTDYGRNVVVRAARLAIDDIDDALKGDVTIHELAQDVASQDVRVENHVLAAYDKFDESRSFLLNGTERVPESEMILGEDAVTNAVTQLDVDDCMRRKRTAASRDAITFQKLSIDQICDKLSQQNVDLFPVQKNSNRLYAGSTLLEAVEPKKATQILTPAEAYSLADMTLAEIMSRSGVKSLTTASRIRKTIRESIDPSIGEANATPSPFTYKSSMPIVWSRLRRSAKCRKILFSENREDLASYVKMLDSNIQEKFPSLSISSIKRLKADIAYMCPDALDDCDQTVDEMLNELRSEASQSEAAENRKYEYWETLSPQEVAEIASCDRRNIPNIAKRFNMSRDSFHTLRINATALAKGDNGASQANPNKEREGYACLRVIREDWSRVETDDLLIFCKTNYDAIIEYHAELSSSTTPSKSQLRKMKNIIRRQIAKHI